MAAKEESWTPNEDEILTRGKNEGNEKFKQRDFEKAIQLYSQALDRSGVLGSADIVMTILANRAAAYLELRQWELVIRDTSEVLNYDPNHIKARFRKATALKELGRIEEAIYELAQIPTESRNREIDRLEGELRK